MDKHIARLYKDAPRFDEGEFMCGQEYCEATQRRAHIHDLLISMFGARIQGLLDDYTAMLYEEMELEAQHYFQEGYRMAQKQLAKATPPSAAE